MSDTTERFVVLSTAPDADVAEQLAAGLVQGRWAACVSVLPGVRSVYRWQGQVHNEAEVLMVAKTDADHLPGLIQALGRAHPYECPEIVALPVAAGLPDYLRWIGTALRPA